MRNYSDPHVKIAAVAGLLSFALWSGCRASGQKRTVGVPLTPVMVTEVTLRDVAVFSEVLQS